MSLVLSYMDSQREDYPLAASGGTQYSLKMINNSSQPWTFYVYQKAPQPSSNVFSLAWFASPFMIRDGGDSITFKWEITYNFVWSATGLLIPGVTFDAMGTKPANPNGENTTTFSTSPGPGLSTPVQAPPEGSLVIKDANDVPNNKFSVGIGMSGTGTYAVQAGTNLKHQFTPTPSYWVGAGIDLQIGTVLSIQTSNPTKEVKFPPAVFSMEATIGEDNLWTIKPA